MNFTDDIPKYKKKSQKKPPKKAKHKHLCEPCIITRPVDWYMKEHTRSGKTKDEFYGYCPICGKVMGYRPNNDLYYKRVKRVIGEFSCLVDELTEEGEREMNPATRTIPTFVSDDCFIKFVEIED